MRQFRILRLVIPIVAVFGVTSALGVRWVRPKAPPPAPDVLVPIVAPESGKLMEWTVAPGSQILPGQILVRLQGAVPSISEEPTPTDSPVVAVVPTEIGSISPIKGRIVGPPSPPDVAREVPAPGKQVGQGDKRVQARLDLTIAGIEETRDSMRGVTESITVVDADVAAQKVEVGALETRLEEENASVERTTAKRNKNKELLELGAVSRKVFERADLDAAQALASRDEIQASLDAALSERTSLEDNRAKLVERMSQLQAELKTLEDDRVALEQELAKLPAIKRPAAPSPHVVRPRVEHSTREPLPAPIPMQVFVDSAALSKAKQEDARDLERKAAIGDGYFAVEAPANGTFQRAEVKVGSVVAKGEVLGWVRLAKKY